MKSTLAMVLMALCFAGSGLLAADKVADIAHDDLVKVVKGKNVVLIDCNGSESYNSGHIPGAMDFKAVKEEELAKKLPADKNALIVAYCGNELCTAYKAGAEAVVKLGYTNVKHYPGGIAGWKKSGEPTDKAN